MALLTFSQSLAQGTAFVYTFDGEAVPVQAEIDSDQQYAISDFSYPILLDFPAVSWQGAGERS
jgi:hypothetical protein